MKTLFIGAGASFGARLNNHGLVAPPLGADLLVFLRQNINRLSELVYRSRYGAAAYDLNTAVGILDKHSTEMNFERFLPRLDEHEREVIHRTLQVAFSDLKPAIDIDLGFVRSEDRYDELIRTNSIQPNDWIVISLNYDLLFEDALTRIGIPFHYPVFPFALGQDAPANSLPVFKPHGSINFFAQPDIHVVSGNQPPTRVREEMMTKFYKNADGRTRPHYPIAYAGMSGPENVITRVGQNTSYPVVANYAAGKDSDVNQPDLVAIRKQAIEAACKTDCLLIVGVNPILDRKDDPFCAELLGHEFDAVTYVGFGAISGTSIRSRFPRAELYLDGFADYLEKRSS